MTGTSRDDQAAEVDADLEDTVDSLEPVPDSEAGESGSASHEETDQPDDPEAESTSVEELLEITERVTAERDQYLDLLQRTQAEFENYKRRVTSQQQELTARAAESLVERLLPVLDAFDGAMSHGATEVDPLRTSLLDVLESGGLERIDTADEPYDPSQHDAVMHEPAEGERAWAHRRGGDASGLPLERPGDSPRHGQGAGLRMGTVGSGHGPAT